MITTGDVVYADGTSWQRDPDSADLHEKNWWYNPERGGGTGQTLRSLKKFDDFTWLVKNGEIVSAADTPVGKLQAHIKQLCAQLDEKEEDLRRVRASIDMLQEKLADATLDGGYSAVRVSAAEEKTQMVIKERDQMGRELSYVQADLDKAHALIASLEDHNDDLNTVIEFFVHRNPTLGKTNATLAQDRHVCECADVREQLADMTAERDDFCHRLLNLSTARTKQFQQVVDEKEKLCEQLADMTAERDVAVGSLVDAVEQLEDAEKELARWSLRTGSGADTLANKILFMREAWNSLVDRYWHAAYQVRTFETKYADAQREEREAMLRWIEKNKKQKDSTEETDNDIT